MIEKSISRTGENLHKPLTQAMLEPYTLHGIGRGSSSATLHRIKVCVQSLESPWYMTSRKPSHQQKDDWISHFISHISLIIMMFCTCQDSGALLVCTKFHCDEIRPIFWLCQQQFLTLLEFNIKSKYCHQNCPALGLVWWMVTFHNLDNNRD